jgi:hypothetical protein
MIGADGEIFDILGAAIKGGSSEGISRKFPLDGALCAVVYTRQLLPLPLLDIFPLKTKDGNRLNRD